MNRATGIGSDTNKSVSFDIRKTGPTKIYTDDAMSIFKFTLLLHSI